MADSNPWTDAQTIHLAQLFFSTPRPSFQTMALALNRSASAVECYVSRIGMNAPGASIRRCKPCNRVFFSAGKWERICQVCKRSELYRCA
jgi:hypothetical protein